MGIKKGIRIAAKGIGILLLVCIVVPWVVYIPFVQRAAIHTVESYMNRQGGMRLSVGKIGLRFPLHLTAAKIALLSTPTDTLVACRRLVVRVELLPLLGGEVVVRELQLDTTQLAYADTISQLSIVATVHSLSLTAQPIDLYQKRIAIPLLTLRGGDVELHLGESDKDSSATTTPLPWQIVVDRIELDSVRFAMDMDSTHIAAYLPTARIDSGVVELATQRITVQQLELDNTSGSYGKQGAIPREGIDFEALEIERLELVVGSFVSQEGCVQLALRHLSGVERSGFDIRRLHGDFSLDSTDISLRRCWLTTPLSSLSIEASAATPILKGNEQALLSLQLQGSVGWGDIATLYPSLPLQQLPSITLDSHLTGSLDSLQLHRLQADIPDIVRLRISGYANDVMQREHIEAHATAVATLLQPRYLSPLLGDITTTLPKPIDIALEATFADSVVHPSLLLHLGGGKVSVIGDYNIEKSSYEATAVVQQLPLGKIVTLPEVGNIGGTLSAKGAISPLSLQATARLEMLEYRDYNYTNTELTASLLGDSVVATLATASRGVVATVLATALRDSSSYCGSVEVAIDTLELEQLGFASSPTLIEGRLSATGEAELPNYRLDLAAEQLELSLGQQPTTLSVGHLTLQAINSDSTHLDGSVCIAPLRLDDTSIDTLQLTFNGRDRVVYYDLSIGEGDAYLKELSQLHVKGFLARDTLQVALLQPNSMGVDGVRFDIGAELTTQDSTLRVSLFPVEAVLANERWHINPDNYISIYPHQRFAAKLEMEAAGKQLMAHSLELDGMAQGVLALKLGGIELASLFATTPLDGKIRGELDADMKIGFVEQRPQVVGSVTLANLNYEEQKIGTLLLDVDYEMATTSTQRLDASLELERQPIVELVGGYNRTAISDSLHLSLSLLSLPMQLANPFLPAEVVQLGGSIGGCIELQGNPSAPRLDGYFVVEEGVVDVPMARSRFLVGRGDTVVIEDSEVVFRRFSLRGSNSNPLYLDGTVSMVNPTLPRLDLQLSATDMEVIDVKRGNYTDLYGKINIDVKSTIKGEVDRLQIRGDVGILNGTDVGYVMKDAPLGVRQQSTELVDFVNFEQDDRLLSKQEAAVIRPSGIDMLLNIDIANAVKGGVSLSSDGQNSLYVQGGGNLSYTINRLGDSQFTGKYVLSGGTVSYNPPIITEKEFAISEGSYVVWSGDIANPSFHITAIEKVRTNVTEEGSSGRLVSFDIIIVIANTLDNLSITFDLTAPEDLTIQNELTSLTAEQRASQAMNLLIYNTYTGPGTSAKIAANPLNTFIEKELNSWARNNVRSVDVTFGIDTDDGGVLGGSNSQTNYSYRVSKSFLNDRVKVVVGGGYETNSDSSENLEQNLIDDLSVEYMLNKRENMYIELFRHTGYESILEGEITQTGVGFVIRKKLLKLKDLFKKSNDR